MGFFVCDPKASKGLYSNLLACVPKTLHGERLSPG